jgi:Pentapeptide repeats (8 copies)
MKIQIKNRFDLSVIFECEADTMKLAIDLAITKKIDLSGADLYGANLSRANLSGADLYGANLSEVKRDFISVIEKMPDEIPFLYKALLDGRIDGSVYEGECACLKGTLANAKKCSVNDLSEFGIEKASSSPSERWFMAINKGDIPENNQVSRLTKEWIEEYCKDNRISLPTRSIVWSDEGVASRSDF